MIGLRLKDVNVLPIVAVVHLAASDDATLPVDPVPPSARR
jgi:hypothetical protein